MSGPADNGPGQGLRIAFVPPGPVAMEFKASAAPIRAIMGPVGSAKTSTCLMDLVEKAARQKPSPADGWRRFHAVCIRDTFRNLERTTIRTWLRWFPKEMGKFTGGEGGRPATHRIEFDLGQGPVEFQIDFIGLNDQRVEDAMRGFEFTAAYLNEADLISPDVLNYVVTRWGRYPPKSADGQGGASWWGAILDLNAPDEENWVWRDFVTEPKPGYAFFRQPGGLEPGAENLHNLPGGRTYYEQMVATNPEWYARRFVHNLPGYSRDGKPIYPEFNDRMHVAAAPLLPVRGLPIVIGADAGGTPAAVLCQKLPDGQRLVLDEIVTPVSGVTGPNRFGERINRLLGEDRYRAAINEFGVRLGNGWTAPVVGYADPAAAFGADKEAGERNWIEAVAAKTEIRFKPAPSQELSVRQEAVRVPLSRLIDGQKPGLVISPTCKTLRKAFNSGYRFRRVQLAGVERYEDKPEKNEWSHVMEALQYALLSDGEHLEVTGRREKRERAAAAAAASPAAEYDPMGW